MSVTNHPAMQQDAARALPLCVDLDGTLVRCDTLVEGMLGLAGAHQILHGVVALLTQGRAAFKRVVAAATPVDAALLPYDERLLAYLRAERARGRRLVLVTAADATIAQAVADHLGLFDAVMASDGATNLKGAAKAAALVARFGAGCFVYAGDSRADLPVWREAAAAVVVNAHPRVRAAAQRATQVELVLETQESPWAAMLRALRPYQWVKNLLIFVPIATAHAISDAAAWRGAIQAFAAFSAIASAIYLLNDLMDLSADRRHPRKRLRPFAAGAAPPQWGIALAMLLLAVGLGIAYAAGVLVILLVYAALSISYSVKLKTMPLIDVFALAALYTIRLVCGGEATGHLLSLWLLGFSSFLFLSLALVKRVAELKAVADLGLGGLARRGYLADDVTILQTMGCGAAFASSLVLALFVQSQSAADQYATPGLLWGAVPLMLFWQCRLWLSTARGWMKDDPIVFAARDWVSWLVVICALGLLVVARTVTLPMF